MTYDCSQKCKEIKLSKFIYLSLLSSHTDTGFILCRLAQLIKVKSNILFHPEVYNNHNFLLITRTILFDCICLVVLGLVKVRVSFKVSLFTIKKLKLTDLQYEKKLFAIRFSSGLVRAMICLLRWTALLWTINSIPCTFGMAVIEQTGTYCMYVCMCLFLMWACLTVCPATDVFQQYHLSEPMYCTAKRYQPWTFSYVSWCQQNAESFNLEHLSC